MNVQTFPTIKVWPLVFLALKDLFKLRIILVICLPVFFSILLWVLVSYWAWDDLQNWSVQLAQTPWMQRFLNLFSASAHVASSFFTFMMRLVFLVLFIVPMIIITATVVTSIFLVPVLVDEIRKTDFPTLMKKSSSIYTGWSTTLSYAFKYFLAWIGSLPFWFVPFLSLIIPYLLLSWFNSRVFSYEVLTEIATPAEIEIFMSRYSRTIFAIGLGTSWLYSIPVINFFAPLIASALFSRYCLTQFNNDLKILSAEKS